MFVYFFTEYAFARQDGQNRNLKIIKDNKKRQNRKKCKENHTTKVTKKEKKEFTKNVKSKTFEYPVFNELSKSLQLHA